MKLIRQLSVFFFIILFTIYDICAEDFAGKRLLINQTELENIVSSQKDWLPSVVQDKISTNFQECTDFIIIDNVNEEKILKLQKSSEGIQKDFSTNIEAGKILNAEYALFSTIKKTDDDFILSIKITNLTFGNQIASCNILCKSADEIYNTDGCAINRATVKLCDQMNIILPATKRYVLLNGEEELSIAQQLELEKMEQEKYLKQIESYTEQIKHLSRQISPDAQIEQAKLQSLKALDQAKLLNAQEREKRLIEEKIKADEDLAKDLNRNSLAIARRNSLSNEITEKIRFARNSRIDSLNIFERINTIEQKKKIIIEINQNVNEQIKILEDLAKTDIENKIKEITERPYRQGELSEGKPTQIAKNRRTREIYDETNKINEKTKNDIFDLRESVSDSIKNLTYDIYYGYDNLRSSTKKISSLSNKKEVQVKICPYDATKKGWKFYTYFYSDGIQLGEKTGYIFLRNLVNKNYNLGNDSDYQDYLDDVDVYTSLFMRGEPVVTFEVDYSANVLKEFDSEYKITLRTLRILDTISGRIIQQIPLSLDYFIKTSPVYDIETIIADYKDDVLFEIESSKREKIRNDEKQQEALRIESLIETNIISMSSKNIMKGFVKIPNKGIKILATEVTQSLYEEIMNVNPSNQKENCLPVETVSWLDCIIFCNKLSLKLGLTPCYVVSKEVNPNKWIIPSDEANINKFLAKIRFNNNANGFRLPNLEEMNYLAEKDKDRNFDEMFWTKENSEGKSHVVATKKGDSFGLYDIYGNVAEWCDGNFINKEKYIFGGSWLDTKENIKKNSSIPDLYTSQFKYVGFRIVCSD